LREVETLRVRVSCTCPSWLFWGAQWNAFMGDYLYGKIQPKLTSPKKRDPSGRFLVCKHVMACIPIVSKYRLSDISKIVREKLKKAPKVEVNTKNIKKEKIKIPAELRHIAYRPSMRKAIKDWNSMSTDARRDFVMGLKAPSEVAFMGHRFPLTATGYVAEKLRDMSKQLPQPSLRRQAARFLKWFV